MSRFALRPRRLLAIAAICVAVGGLLAAAGPGKLAAAEFSGEATVLPFPPDARELEFDAKFGDIKFNSNSPLKSLAAFYLKEMAARGWQHDEAAAVAQEDAIKLTFKHEKVVVKLELKQWSKEVKASLDCENLQFTGTDDPAKLAAAGIPVPRAILFLQKELPLPAGAVNLQYTGEGCTFKSPLKLQEAFDHFTKLAAGKGFRESRRPIVTGTRRYTEFKSGAAELSVNVFTDAVGSRIILTYKDAAQAAPVPPLAAVASLPIKLGGASAAAAGANPATNTAATPIDVTSNKGSATVIYAGKQYTFANVACYQTKSRGTATHVLFSAKPIAVNKMQALIASKNDFSFGDLYEFGYPEHLIVELGERPTFQFATSNVSVGNSVTNPSGEMKATATRVQGTLKMAATEIFKGESLSFTATADAAIITPTTRIVGPGDPVLKSDNPLLAEAPLPFPGEIQNAGSEGTKFRKKYTALVTLPLAEVAAFYRQELTAKGWKQPAEASDVMELKNDKLDLAVTLKSQRDKTAIEILVRNHELARQEGIFPEAGKGRIVLGNASDVAVAFTIGTASFALKAHQGEKDHKQAANQSLAPGAYNVILKVAGQQPQTEKIELAAGTTWGLIALPGGGCLSVQLY